MGCRVPTAVQSPCGHTKTAYVGGRDTGFQPNPSNSEGDGMLWTLLAVALAGTFLLTWAALHVSSRADDDIAQLHAQAQARRQAEQALRRAVES